MIYISYKQPSKEEFVEIYWKIYKSEEFGNANTVNCLIENCTKSGIYRTGNINLNGINFETIIIDLNKSSEYEYVCIDLNGNNVYCEKDEGPFKKQDTFLVGDNGFNILSISESSMVIAHYPKGVRQEDFIVKFAVKSHYHATMSFNTTLFVDDYMIENKVLTLNSNEEIISNFNVKLLKEGLHTVKIMISSVNNENVSEINFWVTKN